MAALSTNWKQLEESLRQEKEQRSSGTVLLSCSDFKEQQNFESGSSNNSKFKHLYSKNGIFPLRKPLKRHHRKQDHASSLNSLNIVTAVDDNLKRVTKVLGLDCEYVGVGVGGTNHMLARVSIVNMYGQCIYDKYVKPREKVVDYRTAVSGIRPENVQNGEPFWKVQLEVHKLLANRIVVGHSLVNDFKVLEISHTRKLTRDTARYLPLREKNIIAKTPSLKLLAKKLLGVDIQNGEHDSVVDARIAMEIYVLYRNQWENDVRSHKNIV